MHRKLFALFISLAPVLYAGDMHAQSSSRFLSLKEAIDSALVNNKDLYVSQLDEKIAHSKWKSTEAFFLPQVDISVTGLTTDNPLNAFGFRLQQQSVTQADFIPETLNHPGNRSDFNSQIQLKQPVFNPASIFQRKAMLTQKEIASLKTQRMKEYLSFEVEKAYLQLQLAHDAVQVWQETLNAANALETYISQRVKEGLLSKSDELNVKVWIATVESGLTEAKSSVANASDYISLLMGTRNGMLYTVAPGTKPSPAINVIQEVPAARADLAALRKALTASEQMMRSTRVSHLPRLNAFGTYQIHDNRLAGFGSSSYLAGLQLSWDIFKGNSTRNQFAEQVLEHQKIEKQLAIRQEQSQLELNKANRQLADARYKISQQESAVENAAEALRILQDRFAQGLVSNTDVLLAQSQLSRQKLSLAESICNYNITSAWSKFLVTSKSE